MSTIKPFEKIEVAKDFGMKYQVCRAAVSIMGNIAEGYESQTEAVFIRYLGIAKGSARELRSQHVRLVICAAKAAVDSLYTTHYHIPRY